MTLLMLTQEMFEQQQDVISAASMWRHGSVRWKQGIWNCITIREQTYITFWQHGALQLFDWTIIVCWLLV